MLVIWLGQQITLKTSAGSATNFFLSFHNVFKQQAYDHNHATNGTDLFYLSILLQTTRDTAPIPETITGTGDALPSEIGSKRLHNDVSQDLSKGHQRYDKHVKQKGSDQEKGASEGPIEDEVVDGVVGGR